MVTESWLEVGSNHGKSCEYVNANFSTSTGPMLYLFANPRMVQYSRPIFDHYLNQYLANIGLTHHYMCWLGINLHKCLKRELYQLNKEVKARIRYDCMISLLTEVFSTFVAIQRQHSERES